MKLLPQGIKSKVLLSCVSIGLILLLSTIISFFEFGRMSRYISDLVADNIASVNISRIMLNNTDEYNTRLFYLINDEVVDTGKFYDRKKRYIREFDNSLKEIKGYLNTKKEKMLSDSVSLAYDQYIERLNDLDSLWFAGYEVRKNWYFEILQPVHEMQRTYIQRLSYTSQNSLTENYNSIQDNYSRVVTPGVVAMAAGIILIVLFNAFLNYYILSPIVRMNKALEKYKKYNKSYDVDIHTDSGQIFQINQNIKEIILENKKLKDK